MRRPAHRLDALPEQIEPPAHRPLSRSCFVTGSAAASPGCIRVSGQVPDKLPAGRMKYHRLRTTGPLPPTDSEAEPDLLIRFPRLMRADLDRDFTIQPFEEIEQLVGGEAVEMPVHQVGDFRLFDPE
jgi:hypothetical protein